MSAITLLVDDPGWRKPRGLVTHLKRAAEAALGSDEGDELREAEVVVKPALDGVGSASFGERQRSIQAGRQAMLLALPELKRYLQP